MSLRGLLLAALLLGGCATPAQTRYYSLDAGEPAAAAQGAGEYGVAVGPVTLPEALDRPQLVLRAGAGRYRVVDEERWIEPLKTEIPRVLAGDLARRLPAARVASHVQHGGRNADYRILIDIQRFESVLGESVTLDASWSLRGARGGRSGRSTLTEPVGGADYAELVAAHRRALARLGEELAEAIEALRRESPPAGHG